MMIIDGNGEIIVNDISSDDGSNEISEEKTPRTFTIKLNCEKIRQLRDAINTDKRYYEYIRSLCSVHPGNTDRYKRGSESCPFVVWTHPPLDDKGDLFALVYINDGEHTEHSMYVSISEVFGFVEKRMEIVNKIVKGIMEYNEAEITKPKEIPLKSKADFSSYSEYLEYLAQEKMSYLDHNGKHNDNSDRARCQLLIKKNHFLNNVVYGDEIEDKEPFYLVHANIYANNLKVDCLVNASVPSSNLYRITK